MNEYKIKSKDILKLMWSHTMKYKWLFFISLISSALVVLTEIFQPWLLRWFFDTLAISVPNSEFFSELFNILLIILGVSILRWIARRVVGFTSAEFQPRVVKDLQMFCFKYIQDHSYDFFSNNFAGSLVRKINRLARSYERIEQEFKYEILPAFLVLLGALISFYIRFKLIALIFFVWVVIFILFNYFASNWKLKVDIQRAEADSEATGTLADVLTNIVTVKLFTGEEYEFKRYGKHLERARIFHRQSWHRAIIIFAIQGMLMIFIEFLLMYYGLVLWKEGVFTLGDLILLQGLLTIVFMKVWSIGRSFRNIYEAMADAKEMVDLLNQPYEIKDIPSAKNLQVVNGMVEFKDVVFHYNKTRKVLDKLNLNIYPQEKVALVGSSGAGKSTLIKLLLRFFDLTSGKICIDGQDISRVTQESLRKSISFVPQEPILFHRSLLENIRYGRREASDDEVIEAAKKAHCHEFIQQLPDGYETYVGERGIKLSGGERQRVAIARAILKNAPILILDEATASLDSESEVYIQEALEELMKDKTTIVIAHRLSTIMKMDRIVVIENGRVVDMGTHKELLNKKGIYKKLWDIQAGGFLQ